MSYELIAFLVAAAVILLVGWLAIASLRREREALEEIAYGEASFYRREKNND